MNKHQIFLAGLVFLFLGGEFRLMDSFVLTPDATRMLAEHMDSSLATTSDTVQAVTGGAVPPPKKQIRPPDWIGWMFVSLGAVLVLQSLAMVKPTG